MADDTRKAAKLPRSETVTVRLDPKLRYLVDLGARKQRRTLSSFIEWAVELSLRDVKVSIGAEFNEPDATLEMEANYLWDVDVSERFIRLAIRYPELLSHEEQEQWKMLSDSGLLNPARQRVHNHLRWDISVLEDRVFPEVRRQWEALVNAHSTGPGASAMWVQEMRRKTDEGEIYPASSQPVPTSSPPPARRYAPAPAPKGFEDVDDDIPF